MARKHETMLDSWQDERVLRRCASGFNWNEINDDEPLYFGDSDDISLKWDSTNNVLEFLPVANDTGAVVFGDGSTDCDVKFFMGSGVYALFDVGNARFSLVGVDTATNAPVVITDSTATSSTTTGALIVTGGIATAADITLGDDMFFAISGGSITVDADNTTIYGGDTSADQLRLRGNSVDAGPILYVVGNSRVYIAGQFQVSERVYINSSMDLQQGQYLYFGGDASTEYIRSNTAQELQLGANSVVRIAAPYLTMLTANKLAFRDAELFINSPADGRLGISSDGTGTTAISIDVIGGQITINTVAINYVQACYLNMSAAATGSYGLKLGVAADGFSIYTDNGDIMVFDTRVGGAVQFPTNVNMSGLPVADPHVVGCLWNNGTVVTVSAG